MSWGTEDVPVTLYNWTTDPTTDGFGIAASAREPYRPGDRELVLGHAAITAGSSSSSTRPNPPRDQNVGPLSQDIRNFEFVVVTVSTGSWSGGNPSGTTRAIQSTFIVPIRAMQLSNNTKNLRTDDTSAASITFEYTADREKQMQFRLYQNGALGMEERLGQANISLLHIIGYNLISIGGNISTTVETGSTITGIGTNTSPLEVAVPVTTAEKTKLASIETGAEVNVQADLAIDDINADTHVKNRQYPITPGYVSVDSTQLTVGRGTPITRGYGYEDGTNVPATASYGGLAGATAAVGGVTYTIRRIVQKYPQIGATGNPDLTMAADLVITVSATSTTNIKQYSWQIGDRLLPAATESASTDYAGAVDLTWTGQAPLLPDVTGTMQVQVVNRMDRRDYTFNETANPNVTAANVAVDTGIIIPDTTEAPNWFDLQIRIPFGLGTVSYTHLTLPTKRIV